MQQSLCQSLFKQLHLLGCLVLVVCVVLFFVGMGWVCGFSSRGWVVGWVGFLVWAVLRLPLGWVELFLSGVGMLGYVGWDGMRMGGYNAVMYFACG
jgi:hypothetical protein